jgi:hypothetical protein
MLAFALALIKCCWVVKCLEKLFYENSSENKVVCVTKKVKPQAKLKKTNEDNEALQANF